MTSCERTVEEEERLAGSGAGAFVSGAGYVVYSLASDAMLSL